MTRAELLSAIAQADATIREQQAVIAYYRTVLAQADAAIRAAMDRAGMTVQRDAVPLLGADRRH